MPSDTMNEQKELDFDPKFGQFSNLNISQTLYGFKSLGKSVFTRPKNLKELTDEEIMVERVTVRNSMHLAWFEFFLGFGVIGFFLLLAPDALSFIGKQFVRSDIKVVSWVILMLLIVGIVIVIFKLLNIQAEYKNLVRLFYQSRVISYKGLKKIPFRYLLPPQSSGIVHRKIDALLRIARDQGTVPHGALADVLFTKQSTSSDIPNYLANAMTMVGLIGTIIGLSNATGGMQVLFSSVGDLSQLKEGFTQTLTGIDVAFFTTLLGAVCMLVLKYFNIVSRKSMILLLVELEQVVITEIIPKLKYVSFSDSVKSDSEMLPKYFSEYSLGRRTEIDDELSEDDTISFIENDVEKRNKRSRTVVSNSMMKKKGVKKASKKSSLVSNSRNKVAHVSVKKAPKSKNTSHVALKTKKSRKIVAPVVVKKKQSKTVIKGSVSKNKIDNIPTVSGNVTEYLEFLVQEPGKKEKVLKKFKVVPVD